jgi:hypothetical protein
MLALTLVISMILASVLAKSINNSGIIILLVSLNYLKTALRYGVS